MLISGAGKCFLISEENQASFLLDSSLDMLDML